ncbi:MAG: carbon storage regulator [Firmicutes bacterium HGW-Firmicutes-13]|nr:MAG: carbon storage regulator [Firmicutes bacterium HGW-Firmicutes-13]
MLILSRKSGQSLVIGENITVKILEVSGDNIKIGIEAPREIPVHRQEVFETIKKENKAAAMVKRDVLSYLPRDKEE